MGTFIVTGATGGVGAAVVRVLHDRGHAVLAAGRDRSRLDELCRALPAATPLVVDLQWPESLADAVVTVDVLDGLVHCAAVAEIATVADSPVVLWQQTLTVNVVSVAELTRLLLPALRRRGGHVVMVGASVDVHGAAGWAAYAASKAALRDLADALRVEESANGVRVTSLHPGAVATDLLRRLRKQSGRPYDPAACLSPESVAATVADCLERRGDAHLTDLHMRRVAGPPAGE